MSTSSTTQDTVDKPESVTPSQSMDTKAADLPEQDTIPQTKDVEPEVLNPDISIHKSEQIKRPIWYEEARAERKRMSVLRPGINRTRDGAARDGAAKEGSGITVDTNSSSGTSS